MEDSGFALEKNVADLTVMDVYDIAAVVGQEFERIIDQYGCEALSRLIPKVVRVLEILEVMVSRSSIEELRLELDRLRLERMDRLEKDKKHRQELERVEDVWRGEAQDLLSQIAQLQEENKHLLSNMPIKDSMNEEDLQRPEGDSESGKERHHGSKAGSQPEHPGILLGLDEGCPHPGDRLHRPTERHRGGRQGYESPDLVNPTGFCGNSWGLSFLQGAASVREFYAKNSRWTEGLISASKAVGWGATQLLDSADRVVGEQGTYEELIACSHEIAASTAQLVAASKVKADRSNRKLHTLQQASRQVNDMAAVVVTSTKHGQQQISDHGVMDFSGMSLIKLKKEEMEAQVKVLQLESQLEQERVRLGELRKRHYDIRGPENGPEPDDGAESFPPSPPPTLLDSTPIPPSFSQTQPYVHTQSLAQTNPFAPAFSLPQSYTPTQT
ncbi:uncharacterized protein ACNS7B_013920 [Menidia menidia]